MVITNARLSEILEPILRASYGSARLTVGALLAMWAYASNFLFPIRAIVMGLNEIQESVVGVQRVKAYLDEKPEIREIDHPVERRVKGDIRFDGVDFSY